MNKITLKEYMEELKEQNPYKIMFDNLMKELGICDVTLWRKLKNNSFSELEFKVIEKTFGLKLNKQRFK